MEEQRKRCGCCCLIRASESALAFPSSDGLPSSCVDPYGSYAGEEASPRLRVDPDEVPSPPNADPSRRTSKRRPRHSLKLASTGTAQRRQLPTARNGTNRRRRQRRSGLRRPRRRR